MNWIIRVNHFRLQFHFVLYYLFVLGAAFFIPLHPYLARWAVGLIFLNWIAELNFIKKFSLLKKNFKPVLLFSGFYLLYAFSVLYSENWNHAYNKMQTMMALFFVPLVMATSKSLRPKDLKYFLLIFVFSCWVASFWCLNNALVHFSQSGDASAFFYTKFSVIYHPAYMAMYASFAVGVALFYFFKKKRKKIIIDVFICFVILWFTLFIMLLNAKAGFVVLITTFIIMAFFGWRKYGQLRKVMFLLSAVFLLSASFVMVIPQSMQRVKAVTQDVSYNREKETAQPKVKTESISARVAVWKASLNIIKRNWAFGVGIGDSKDVLLDYYKDNNLTNALSKELNSHNQFLQTAMATGILGLIWLISYFWVPFWKAKKQHNSIYLVFLIGFVLSIMVESMFETQAGVFYFAYLNSLLFFFGSKNQ